MVIFFVIALVPFYAVGFVLLYQGWEDIRRGVRARAWPVAPAQWKTCVLEQQTTARGAIYRVCVAYEYRVAGRLYQGDNVAVGYVGSGAREVHAALYERLSGMRPFVVRYSPGQPEISTILPAENSLVYGTLVWGLAWLAVTTVGVLVALLASGHGVLLWVWASGLLNTLIGR